MPYSWPIIDPLLSIRADPGLTKARAVPSAETVPAFCTRTKGVVAPPWMLMPRELPMIWPKFTSELPESLGLMKMPLELTAPAPAALTMPVAPMVIDCRPPPKPIAVADSE